MLPSPPLRHVADFDIDLSPIEEMGDGRGGMRRIIPIVGGRVSGPAFTGEILNIGADWQTIFSSGLAELDTRYAFRTDDDAVIEIINFGYRRGPEGRDEAHRRRRKLSIRPTITCEPMRGLKPATRTINGSMKHCFLASGDGLSQV